MELMTLLPVVSCPVNRAGVLYPVMLGDNAAPNLRRFKRCNGSRILTEKGLWCPAALKPGRINDN
jgi:hypothetical protein